MAKITVSPTKEASVLLIIRSRVVIDDFAFDAGDRFTYEYNFFEHWIHDIRIEAIQERA
uniref:plasmid pRiA4b ORF-3 family protein n=1 Tax=Yersiniaceae TaxID=1903411 RepID=UPI002076B2EB|nr:MULTISPECIES: plasmid pRiA4b ORF-3 family protein [Yersiniaceae]